MNCRPRKIWRGRQPVGAEELFGDHCSQQELETHQENGQVRTEDGRKVNTRDGNAQNDGERDDSAEHSSPGGPTEPGSAPGSLD